MRPTFSLVASAIVAALIGPPPAIAQDSYSVEVLSEAPPDDLADPVREALAEEGIRVLDEDGEPVLDFWLRKSVPIEGERSDPANSILYPFLKVGQFVGAVRVAEDTGDYKDQVILPGVYTMRYALQPVDGDHLGVSNFRDYFLLSYADEDIDPEPITQDDLESLSTGPSGTNHPSVFLLLQAKDDAEAPSIVLDEKEKRASVVLKLSLEVEGDDDPDLVTQLVIEGAGPH
jgi:hypothetical protein